MTTMTPIGLCQRYETLLVAGSNAKNTTNSDAAEQPDERAVAVGPLEGQREHEDAEQRAVEDRTDAVDDLDQRSELHGDVRDDAGDEAPEGDGERDTIR